jgi:hypothetical protein
MQVPSLLLEFDPRVLEGRDGLRERHPDVPASIPEWETLLQGALEAADRLGVDSAAVREVERARSEYSDLSSLGRLGLLLPQRYQRPQQLALLEFLRELATRGWDEAQLRPTLRFLAHALEHGLLVRIGTTEEQEAEAREVLVLADRRSGPVDPAALPNWTGGAAEVPAVQELLDELLVLADRLGLDTKALGKAEFEIRRQPSPGRLRDDEDVAELLAFADALDARVKLKAERVPEPLQSRLSTLRELLRFAASERLLLSTRAA